MKGEKTMSTKIAEHPIIFNSDSIKAILDGRKTQTRIVLKPQPEKGYHAGLGCEVFYYKGLQMRPYADDYFEAWYSLAPYKVGDLLWVRESFCIDSLHINNFSLWGHYSSDGKEFDCRLNIEEQQKFSKWKKQFGNKPSIFMFKSLARLWLEIISIRVEQIQSISNKDCVAEGIKHCTDLNKTTSDYFRFTVRWDSNNAKRGFGWNKNPYCWVIEFKRIEK